MFLNQKETSFCTSYLANFGLMMTSFFRNLDAWSSASTSRFHEGIFFFS